MDISFLLFPNLLPQTQNFHLHRGVRQDQFHSIVRHQFLFSKEDNTPLNLSSFFTTSILPSFSSFNFYISYFIISSNLSKNLDRKRSAIFSRLRPAFLPPGRPGMGSPAGSPYHVGVRDATENHRNRVVEDSVSMTVRSDVRLQRCSGEPKARPSRPPGGFPLKKFACKFYPCAPP